MKRYVTATTEFTFESLAQKIADDFNDTVKSNGYSTFKEMKRSMDLESQDIRNDIEYMIKSFTDYEYWMYDDGTLIVNDATGETMSYRQFKKLVFDNVI